MLHTAAADLHAHGRAAFGYAPTAHAARVLETGIGVGCDTVAELPYEQTRTDRPPGADSQIATGATAIVDEAGMLATPDLHGLHRLTQLADGQRWRLVLVGEPHQLQAVDVAACSPSCAPADGRSSSTTSIASAMTGERTRH